MTTSATTTNPTPHLPARTQLRYHAPGGRGHVSSDWEDADVTYAGHTFASISKRGYDAFEWPWPDDGSGWTVEIHPEGEEDAPEAGIHGSRREACRAVRRFAERYDLRPWVLLRVLAGVDGAER